MNDQRKVVYEQRADIMDADAVGEWSPTCAPRRSTSSSARRARPIPIPSNGTSPAMKERLAATLNLELPVDDWLKRGGDRPGGGRGARPRRRRRGDRGEGEGSGAGHLDAGREVDPAPESRSSLEGASGDARCAAAGRPPARLCAEDADQRIQAGGVRAVPADARQHPRGCDAHGRACAVPDAAAAGMPELPDFITTHFDPFTGEDNSGDIDAGTRGLVQSQLPPMQIVAAARRRIWATIRSIGRAGSTATRRARVGRGRSTSIAMARWRPERGAPGLVTSRPAVDQAVRRSTCRDGPRKRGRSPSR